MRARSVPATIPLPEPLSATWAAPTSSAELPKRWLRRTRTCEPPVVRCAITRRVRPRQIGSRIGEPVIRRDGGRQRPSSPQADTHVWAPAGPANQATSTVPPTTRSADTRELLIFRLLIFGSLLGPHQDRWPWARWSHDRPRISSAGADAFRSGPCRPPSRAVFRGIPGPLRRRKADRGAWRGGGRESGPSLAPGGGRPPGPR